MRCPGGEIGRRRGLKIPRSLRSCRFKSGPGHHAIFIASFITIKTYNWIYFGDMGLSPSGKAGACKASIPSSNLGGASNSNIKWLGHIHGQMAEPGWMHRSWKPARVIPPRVRIPICPPLTTFTNSLKQVLLKFKNITGVLLLDLYPL